MRPSILINRQAEGGDVLMTTPIVRKLYNDYNGECDIDFFVIEHCREYIENNPYIRAVYSGLPSEETKQNYDRVIDLDLVYEKSPEVHAIDAYAMHVFGNTDFDKSVELTVLPKDKARAQQLLSTIGNYVVLHQRRYPWPSRNIPEEFWRVVVRKILNETELFVVQIGSVREPAFSGHSRLIDARGSLSVPQLKEVIASAKLYMGVDSGPAHVASATETDMLVLYTSVREEYRRPLRQKGKFIPVAANIDCYGCHAKNPAPCTTFICHRGDVDCVNRFDPEVIAQKAIELINK